jgi:hypothetical protein
MRKAAAEQASASQVRAAARVFGRLLGWQSSDNALHRLHEAIPGFGPEASLLKAVAVNQIYSTQVMAIARMGRHVADLMTRSPRPAGVTLVEVMASVPGVPDRRFTSFSAKFCHFFVNEEEYPIYDDAAKEALRLHLAGSYNASDDRPYKAFVESFTEFRRTLGPEGSEFMCRDIDRYLWLTGMYLRWLRERGSDEVRINEELLGMFKSPGPAASDLDEMLPRDLERTF